MTQYTEATKAAVMAALLEGQSVNQVSQEWNIPEGTIKYWRAKSKTVGGVDPQKKERIGELLIDYLSASLETLRIQVEHFRNEAWLSKQNAADVAVLHGVVTDKAIRLLEALASNSDQAEQLPDRTGVSAASTANGDAG